MASSKDIQHSTSRPLSQNRLSMQSTSLPKSHARNHSHSVSSGSLVPSSRVTRRKSVTSNVGNPAALIELVEKSAGLPISSRRNTMSKGSSARAAAVGSLPSPPSSTLSHRIRLAAAGKSERGESAIDDDPNDDFDDDEDADFKQSRMRRASDGQQLMKDGKKASGGDLKCDKCGKGYKHSSCLSKHLWEHTPEWSLTSKLLISKHQQVQLLEAASVLLTMTNDNTTPPDSAKDFHSDQESASPAPSGSELHDGASSTDTTPPPQADMSHGYNSGSYSGRHKRYSSGYSFSRSYQSAPYSTSVHGSSVPNLSGFGHHRQPSHERRPLSSGISRNQDEDDLVNKMSSANFERSGTPRNNAVTLLEDAPPVPNIPAQYLTQASFSDSTLVEPHRQAESYTRHQVRLHHDIKMEESEESVADDDEYDHRSRGRSDEDEEGVFGRMEVE